MNKIELKKRYNDFLKKENLTNEQVWVGSGGTLLLLGLRTKTSDIDIGVPLEVFNDIKSRGLPFHYFNETVLVIEYDEYIDIHLDNGTEEHTIIEGVGSWTIQEVLKLKQSLNRDKDQQDINNIKKYIKNNVKVVKLNKSHLDSFIEFRNKSNKESEYINKINKENAKKLITDWNTDKKQGYLLTLHDKIIGQLFVTIDKNLLYINLISILKDYYGMGVSTFLIKCVEEIARLNRINKIELIVHKNNISAIRFYEKNDFQLNGKYNLNNLIYVKELNISTESFKFNISSISKIKDW